MRTLYFDCSSGIAGDMAVAALLDLGADHKALMEGIASLGLDGCELRVRRVRKNGVDACGFDVSAGGDAEIASAPEGEEVARSLHEPGGLLNFNADNSQPESGTFYTVEETQGQYGSFYTNDSPETQEGSYRDVFPRDEESVRNDEPATRDMGEIRELIESSGISSRAKGYALRIFDVVARAEGKVHSVPPDEVRFHEFGAVDSIVDIVGVSILIDSLDVDRIICSAICEGQGTVRCGQGIIPVPAPATLEIVRSRGIPLRITENQGEMATPAGVAIVAALADGFSPPGEGNVLAVGYGAGTRAYEQASGLLRVVLMEEGGSGEDGSGQVCELACNLDDIASEALAFACEELMRAGAQDVWVIPTVIKYGRPGHILGLLCEISRKEEFSMLIFRHTSATAIRASIMDTIMMRRHQLTVATPYGPVVVNESSLGGYHKIKVDFDSAKALAREKNLSINQILSAAYSALGRKYEGK